MLKILVIWITALLTPQISQVDVGLAQKVLSQSVLVRVKQYTILENGAVKRGMGGCSGTYVGPQTVLTAAHCFSRPTTEIWIRGYGTVSREAKLIKIDEGHDLALLSVKGPYVHAIAKLAKYPRLGSQIVSVGSPFSMEFLISEGIVAQNEFRLKDFKSSYTVHTGMINPGSSGGGAFDSEGDLVGVNTMTIGNPFGWAGISLAVSIYDIKEFLQ